MRDIKQRSGSDAKYVLPRCIKLVDSLNFDQSFSLSLEIPVYDQ